MGTFVRLDARLPGLAVECRLVGLDFSDIVSMAECDLDVCANTGDAGFMRGIGGSRSVGDRDEGFGCPGGAVVLKKVAKSEVFVRSL